MLEAEESEETNVRDERLDKAELDTEQVQRS